jgi:tetratricopeptide (TPR) repeat protein
MSPEQSDGSGAVDTRSDVYSLGVVLYELLAGVLPFAAERLRRASDEETRRILREEEPKSPSTRLSGATPDIHGIAERRGSDVGTLQRQLRGEIDWIVMKALAKEPGRRYATASELAADVERYLDGLPVVAGPPGRLYQARKFVGRHRVAVAALATAFLGLAAVAITFGLLLHQTEKERAIAETERRKAEQISGFLVDLFSLQDPVAMRGETVTPRQLLDLRAEKVVSQLGAQPDVQAGLLDTLARAYRNLGLFDQCVRLLERSLEVRRAAFGDDALETAGSWHQLGAVLGELGRNAEAEPHLRRAYELRLRELGPSDPHTLNVAVRLASLLRTTGRFSDAEAFVRGSLREAEATDLGPNAVIRFQLRGELATTLLREGKFDEAGAAFREALADPVADDDPVLRADVLNNYAAMLIERGDYARAEPPLREALAIRRKMMGERHSRTITTLANLALLVHQTGRFDEAELLYRENIERQREVFGARNRQVVSPLYNLALLELDRGRPKDAEPIVREALSIQVETTGESHPDVAYQLTLLGRIQKELGRNVEAEATLRKGLALRRAKLDPSHPEVASSLSSLAWLLTDTGRAAEAEPLLREALAIRKKALRAGDARTAETESLLGACLTKLGRLDEAEPLLVEAGAILAKGKPAQRAASARRLEELRAAKGARGS